jgi:dTDP-glucose 4,6-dehydratase
MRDGSILLSGAAGFIGSNFAHEAVGEFENVYILDKLTYAGSRERLADIRDRITIVEGDIRDRSTVRDLYESVDYVVNFAAESHVDRSISDGQDFVKSNVLGAFVMMDALRDADIDTFVQFSTDEVYGSTDEGAFSETDQLDPSSPYSASKASADMFANAMWETYDLPITVVRPTNVYGPRQHPEKLIPKFTLRSLKGKSLPLYGDGSNVRQWLYVSDLCEVLLSIIRSGDHTTYNLAGPSYKTNLEVAEMIVDNTGQSPDLIEFVEDRKGHDYRYALTDQKLTSALDVQTPTEFEEGLAKTVAWYKDNADQFR